MRWLDKSPARPHHTPVPEYEPREHVSASSLDLASRCRRAWGYRYLEGRKDPEVPWSETMVGTPRQKSAALGKAVHAVLEEYYRGGSPNWGTRPGQIALAGRAWLPGREECDEILPERPVSLDSTRYVGGMERIEIQGYEDLVVRQGRAWYLYDYKTTKDFKWQKTEAEVVGDEQGCVYPLDIMDHAKVDILPGRWVYMRTTGKPASERTDVVFYRELVEKQFRDLIVQASVLRSEVREFRKGQLKVLDLQPNRLNCDSYGGCPYHLSRGGPCDGYSYGTSAVFSEVKKVDLNDILTSQGWAPPIMPLAHTVATPQVAPPPVYTPPSAITQAYLDPGPGESSNAGPEPKKGRGRPKGAKNKPKDTVVETTGECVGETTVGPAAGPPVQPVLSLANDIYVVRVASTHPLWETLHSLAKVVK